jgi:hypothetical protein
MRGAPHGAARRAATVPRTVAPGTAGRPGSWPTRRSARMRRRARRRGRRGTARLSGCRRRSAARSAGWPGRGAAIRALGDVLVLSPAQLLAGSTPTLIVADDQRLVGERAAPSQPHPCPTRGPMRIQRPSSSSRSPSDSRSASVSRPRRCSARTARAACSNGFSSSSPRYSTPASSARSCVSTAACARSRRWRSRRSCQDHAEVAGSGRLGRLREGNHERELASPLRQRSLADATCWQHEDSTACRKDRDAKR